MWLSHDVQRVLGLSQYRGKLESNLEGRYLARGMQLNILCHIYPHTFELQRIITMLTDAIK